MRASDPAHRFGERSVSHRRRSARSRSSTSASEDVDPPHGGRLSGVSQGRQNTLANASADHALRHTKEEIASREASVAACEGQTNNSVSSQYAGTPTRVVKTPPTKVRQCLCRAGTPVTAANAASCSVSPMLSPPQHLRAPVEKVQPNHALSPDDAEARPPTVDVRQGSGSFVPVGAVPRLPALLSSTFETSFFFPGARARSPSARSSAEAVSRSPSVDSSARGALGATATASTATTRAAMKGPLWSRQRALAEAHERHQTWKQLEVAEQRRLLEATQEAIRGVDARLQAVKVEKRRLEDKLRGVEELHVLTDMLTEKRIRTEARVAKRDTLEAIWQQLQLLCGTGEVVNAKHSEECDDGEQREPNGADEDLNRDVRELASDLDEGAQSAVLTGVHEYTTDSEEDVEDVDSEEDGVVPVVRVRPRASQPPHAQAGRAASPEVFDFPCNRQSVSLVNPKRQHRHSADMNAPVRGADEDSGGEEGRTPSMEPLGPFSPEEEPLEVVLPRLSEGTSDQQLQEEGRSGSRRSVREGERGTDHDKTEQEEAEEEEVKQTAILQPSATHRCKQEHLRLARDPSASRARSASLAAGGGAAIAAADPREVLVNFLAELLFEIEEVAQVCIQAPAPRTKTCVSGARRRREESGGAGATSSGDAATMKRGFFSFFGGATESHLSAKPLTTFLTCARRLESAGWLMEQKLQLLARELSTEEEEDALRERLTARLRQQRQMAVNAAARLTEGTDVEEDNVDPPVMVEDAVSKSLFSSSPPSQDEEEGEEMEQNKRSGAAAGPPLFPLPRPPQTADALRDSTHTSSLQKAGGSSTAQPPLGLDAMMPSIAYATPRLTSVSRALDSEQSQVQAAYKDAVEAEKQRHRSFIRRLKEVYRNVEAPALRRTLRQLRWTQQSLTEDLIDLGVTHMVLEWDVRRPLRFVPASASCTPQSVSSRATARLVDAACDARLFGNAMRSSTADEATAARFRRCVTIRIPVSTVIRASLERYRIQRQQHEQRQRQQEDEEEELTEPVDGDTRHSSYRTSTRTAGAMGEEGEWDVIRAGEVDSAATKALTAATGGLQTVPPKHVAMMTQRPSLGAGIPLPSPRASLATTASSGAGTGASATSRTSSSAAHSGLLRGPSSSTSCSARMSEEQGDLPQASSTSDGLVGVVLASPPRRARSRSCYFKKELIERRVRHSHSAGSAANAIADRCTASQAAGDSPLQVVRVTYKSQSTSSSTRDSPTRERVVVVEEQETMLAPAKVVDVASRRHYNATAGDWGMDEAAGEEVGSRYVGSELLRLTQASAVVISPDQIGQEHALANGAVRATVRFCGEEAARRREAAQMVERRAKEAWQLREALARLEEANFVAEREAEELEAEWSRLAAEREEKLCEARAKVNAIKSFFHVLKKEHAEWEAILSDLKQVMGPEAASEAARLSSSSTVSAPPSLVRRDRRRSS